MARFGRALGGLIGAPFRLLGGVLGRGVGGAMGALDRGMGGQQAEAEARMAQNDALRLLSEIPQFGKTGYGPVIEKGQRATDITSPIFRERAQNPIEFLNAIQRAYSPSEGYKFKESEMLRAAQNSAAQGGFAGTPQSQKEQAELVRALLGEDMQQFLGNVLNIQQGGLEPLEARGTRGDVASMGLADYIGSALGQQAQMRDYGGQNAASNAMNRRNAMLQVLGQLGGLGLGTLGGQFFGGSPGNPVGSGGMQPTIAARRYY